MYIHDKEILLHVIDKEDVVWWLILTIVGLVGFLSSEINGEKL